MILLLPDGIQTIIELAGRTAMPQIFNNRLGRSWTVYPSIINVVYSGLSNFFNLQQSINFQCGIFQRVVVCVCIGKAFEQGKIAYDNYKGYCFTWKKSKWFNDVFRPSGHGFPLDGRPAEHAIICSYG
jgi:hypothetical protein